MNADDASEALDAMASAKRSVAAASAAPLWRHAAFAVLMALIILSVVIDSRFRLVPWAFAMLGVVLLVQWDRRQTGMFVNGYRRGRTLPLTIALVVIMVGLAIGANRLNMAGEHMLALLTSPAAFVVALVMSLWWERIFLSEMGASMTLAGFDPLLQAPARLQVMAVLAQVDSADFSRLRAVTGTSKSVMSKHLSTLGEAGYVALSKAAVEGRQRTWASLTRAGRKAFDAHVAALKRIVEGDARAAE